MTRFAIDPLPREMSLNAYWLGHSFMWGSIHPILLPLLLLGYTDSAKNTLYGLLTFVGLLIAMVIQPLSGAMSDLTRHPLGRRRPWMVTGSVLVACSLVGLVLTKRLWLVAGSYLMLQFSANLAHGPAQGLIPDLVSSGRYGRAAGLKSLSDMLGMILAAGIAGGLLGSAVPRVPLMGLIIALLYVASTAVTCLGAKESALCTGDSKASRSVADTVGDLMAVDMRAHRPYLRLLLSRFFVMFGSFAVQGFVLFYFRDALRLEAPAQAVGRIMMIIGLTIVLVVYPAGVLSERFGRKPLALVACGMAAAGLALLAFARSLFLLYALSVLVGLGLGIFNSVNWAWAVDLVPAAEAGKYLGLSNIATAGSAAVARLLGPVIDLANRWVPNRGYEVLFGLAALAAATGLILTLSVRDGAGPRSARG